MRQYTINDLTVLSYNGRTSMLEEIGTGSLEVSAADMQNPAALDAWDDGECGRKSATLSATLAANVGETPWWSAVGGRGTLSMTDDGNPISGTFRHLKATKHYGEGQTWDVELKSCGVVSGI